MPNSAARPRRGGTMDLPVTQFRTKAEQAYLDHFVAAEKALPGARDNWVADLRRKAIEAYGRLGLPHRRIEAWKYTDLRARVDRGRSRRCAPQACTIDAADVKMALGDARRDASRPIGSSSSRASSGPIFRTSRGLKAAGRRGRFPVASARKACRLAQGRARHGQSARGRSSTRAQHRLHDRRRPAAAARTASRSTSRSTSSISTARAKRRPSSPATSCLRVRARRPR